MKQTDWMAPFELTLAVLVAVLFGSMACCAAEPADPKAAALDRKLDSIVLPAVEFRRASLAEVFQSLVEASRKHDPDKKGVNIILKDRETDIVKDRETMLKITMSLKDVSLRSVLGYVAELTDLSMELEGSDVVFRKPKDKS